jgi:hypothetical protein
MKVFSLCFTVIVGLLVSGFLFYTFNHLGKVLDLALQ